MWLPDADMLWYFSAEAAEDGHRDESFVGHSDASSASGKKQAWCYGVKAAQLVSWTEDLLLQFEGHSAVTTVCVVYKPHWFLQAAGINLHHQQNTKQQQQLG